MYPRAVETIQSNFSEDINTTTDAAKAYNSYSFFPASIRFPLLLSFEIPSLICYIFIISYILFKKSLRSAPNNYVMLIILLISFVYVATDISWQIDYDLRKTVIVQSSAFCFIWWFIDVCPFYACQMLVAWASFERHILIFHDGLLRVKWKNICFHYLPPIVILIYAFLFYIYAFVMIPCGSYFNVKKNSCYQPCYFDDVVLNLWETIVHGMIAIISIMIFSIALIVRIYRSKRRLQQTIVWKKYRKMFFQLISISALYLSINFPLCIIIILNLTDLFDWTKPMVNFIGYLNYFIPLLLPFICLTTLPGVWKKLKKILHRLTSRQIQPVS